MTKHAIRLAPNLTLSVDAVTDTWAILARKGQGKTYAGLKMFEEMHAAGAQCVAVDPVGKWWSLRLAADGKSPGIDLPIFGGLYADLPLEPTAGALIARVVVDRGISAVIDVSLFDDRDMKRFVTDFARELYRLKQRDQSAMHLFVEEASTFAPQDKEDGSDPPMLNAVKKLVRKGRNYGIGVTMIDQRAQDVNKKVLNQASILVVLGTSGTTDRDAIERWVRDKHIDASGLDELASLARGDAFVWIPQQSTFKKVSIDRRWTFDASATPKLGAKRVERKLTPTDVSALREAIGESVKRAEEADPRALQKRVRSLEQELAAASKAAPVVEAKVVERPVLKEAELKRLEKAIGRLQALRDSAKREEQVIVSTYGKLEAVIQEVARRKPAPAIVVPVQQASRANGVGTTPPACDATRLQAKMTTEGLTKLQQEILDGLAWYRAIGVETISRAALAAIVGRRQGGHFNNTVGGLRATGLIDYPVPDSVRLTEKGQAVARSPEATPTLAQLHEAVNRKLSSLQREILARLSTLYPVPCTREELARTLGRQEGGHFNNTVGSLRTMGFIDYPRPGAVVAADILFPPGIS